MNLKERKEILDFMFVNKLAVISTLSSEGPKPESALIAFAETEEFELIFETFFDTRKYTNLKSNNRVSFVIGWDFNKYITLQYEGNAIELEENEIDYYKNIFKAKKTPCTDKFLQNPKVRLFKVVPTWFRYSNYTKAKPLILEEYL